MVRVSNTYTSQLTYVSQVEIEVPDVDGSVIEEKGQPRHRARGARGNQLPDTRGFQAVSWAGRGTGRGRRGGGGGGGGGRRGVYEDHSLDPSRCQKKNRGKIAFPRFLLQEECI